MARKLSPELRELLDIVTEHEPIDLDGVCARAALLSKRSEIADGLRRLSQSHGNPIMRRPDRHWITQHTAVLGRATPADAAKLGDPRWPVPMATQNDNDQITSMADLVRKHCRLPRPQDDLLPSAIRQAESNRTCNS